MHDDLRGLRGFAGFLSVQREEFACASAHVATQTNPAKPRKPRSPRLPACRLPGDVKRTVGCVEDEAQGRAWKPAPLTGTWHPVPSPRLAQGARSWSSLARRQRMQRARPASRHAHLAACADGMPRGRKGARHALGTVEQDISPNGMRCRVRWMHHTSRTSRFGFVPATRRRLAACRQNP